VADQRFGPYELERRLGAGGMAETFVAVRRGPGQFEQRVCLKRILPGLERDPELVRLFLEEARVAARLRHANIVQVIDFGEHEGTPYLVLELIDGVDLRGLMRGVAARGDTIGAGIVSFLAHELATALSVAHGGQSGERVVHRDVSPSNVLLSTAGEVKLSDFGIARALRSSAGTRTGVIKGKVPYMAPEYALRGEVDGRVDLFALGVVLYEVLTGVRPYQGKNDVETLHLAMAGTHVPLLERRPTTPPELAVAVERLLAPRPEARFQSAEALLDALVDVAPPPTARRILGGLVQSVCVAPTLAEPPNALGPTEPASPASVVAVAASAAGATRAPGGRRSVAPGVDAAARGAGPAEVDGAREHTEVFGEPPGTASSATVPSAPPRERTEVFAGTQTSLGALPAREPAARPYATAAPEDRTRTRVPASAVAEAPTSLLGTAASAPLAPSPTGARRDAGGGAELGSAPAEVTADARTTERDPVPLPAPQPAAPRPRTSAGLVPWFVVGVPVVLGLAASAGMVVVATGSDGSSGALQTAPGAPAAGGDGAAAPGAGGAGAAGAPRPQAPAPGAPSPAAQAAAGQPASAQTRDTQAVGAQAPPAVPAPAPADPPRPPVGTPPAEAAPAAPVGGPASLRAPAPSTSAPSPSTPSPHAPSPPAPSPPTSPSPTPSSPRGPTGPRRPRTGATADDGRTTAAEAILTVVVEGGGSVLLDGRAVGASPVSLTVPAGRHVLAIADAPPGSAVTVDIAPGERRRVTLR
jgi:hypothetical protein